MEDFFSVSPSFSALREHPKTVQEEAAVPNNTHQSIELAHEEATDFLEYNSVFFCDLTRKKMADLLDESKINTTQADQEESENSRSGFADSRPQASLPAEQINLSASLMNKMVLLKWEAAISQPAGYFVLERSNNGRLFQAIGRLTVNAANPGPTAYSFIDSKPNLGINYYRFRLVDINKNEHVSRIAAVTIGKNIAATVDAFPNPFQDQIRIRIMSPTAQELQLKVLDTRGISLFAEKVTVNEGANVLDYNFENLPAGVYMFTFTGQDSLVVKRIAKE